MDLARGDFRSELENASIDRVKLSLFQECRRRFAQRNRIPYLKTSPSARRVPGRSIRALTLAHPRLTRSSCGDESPPPTPPFISHTPHPFAPAKGYTRAQGFCGTTCPLSPRKGSRNPSFTRVPLHKFHTRGE
ncbi:unnamed protein product, partial [Iphiclides podalirius]